MTHADDGPDVTVIGAGIAGLTLALALGRVGISCRIHEQAAALHETGAGIQLAPNATRLLDRLGLGGPLRAIGTAVESVEWARWDGTGLIATTPLGDECAVRYGAPYLTAHRADLQRVLLEAVPAGTVVLGARCTGVREDPEGVLLSFDDGTSVRAGLVVGADGIHSVLRESIDADRPRFSGQTIYRGLVPAEQVPGLVRDPKVRLWLGPRQHLVCYPVSAGRQVSFGATVPGAAPSAESWYAAGDLDELRAAYRGWGDTPGELLAAATHVGRWALHDRDPLDRWSTARTTLVGDAAHPMLPFMAQGANQAVEDALALAAALHETRPDAPEALRRYERRRRARTATLQRRSRASAVQFHLDDGGDQRTRDGSMAETRELRSQDWLYAYDADRLDDEPVTV